MGLSAEDHSCVSDAITSAEQSTSGEIFCVLAEKTDDYRAVPFAWAALVALVLPPVLLWFELVSPAIFDGGWQSGNALGGLWDTHAHAILSLEVALSAGLFIFTYLIVRLPIAKRLLTPKSMRRAAVHRTAMESFLSHGIHVTNERTGVLIFMSADDR